jgi:hypothetical protein
MDGALKVWHGRWRPLRHASRPGFTPRDQLAPTRIHSVMSVYVRGMGWVDIKPWRQK